MIMSRVLCAKRAARVRTMRCSRLVRRFSVGVATGRERTRQTLSHLKRREGFSPTPPPPDYVEFRGRQAQEKAIEKSVCRNFYHRTSRTRADHHFVVAPGHVRVGKTRLGQEVPRIIRDSIRLEELAASEHMGITEPVYVFVDFLNGCRFHGGVDGNRLSLTDPLGARLAFAGLGVSRDAAFSVADEAAVLKPAPVVEHIVQSRLAFEGPDNVVPVVVHFDEYGDFIRQAADEFGSFRLGVRAFKNMLASLGGVIVGSGAFQSPDMRKNYFVVPVVTGTSLEDADIRSSRLSVHFVPMTPLAAPEALGMAKEGLEKHMTKPEVDAVLRDVNFRIALGDTGGLPGVVDMLVREPGVEDCWGVRLHELSRRYIKPDAIPIDAMPVVLDRLLGQIPVERADVLSTGAAQGGTPFTVGDMERLGCVLLEPADPFDVKFTLSAPVPLIRTWNEALGPSTRRLDPGLLHDPTPARPWRWQDFEQLHFQVQRAVVNAHARQDVGAASASLRTILRGVCGHEDVLDQEVALEVLDVHDEVKQFIPKGVQPGSVPFSDTSTVWSRQLRSEVTLPIFQNALLCRRGNQGVDARLAFHRVDGRPVVVWFQYKHSELTTDKATVSVQDMVDWHDKVVALLAPNFLGRTELLLVYVTNRQLRDVTQTEAQLLTERPSLAYLTAAQLPFFSRLIAHRGRLQADDEKEDA